MRLRGIVAIPCRALTARNLAADYAVPTWTVVADVDTSAADRRIAASFA